MVEVRFVMVGYGYELGEVVEMPYEQAEALFLDQAVEYLGYPVEVNPPLEELEDYGEAEEVEPEAEAEDAEAE